MRIDRFLWWTRLAKTRSAARALAETGHFRIAGRRIERAASPVRVGDTLTFALGARVRIVRVLALPHRRGPAAEAQACYAELSENASQQGTGD